MPKGGNYKPIIHNGITHIGEKFGRLTVLSLVNGGGKFKEGKRQRVTYKCKCDCGNETICRWDGLKSGASKSCGCLSLEKFIKRNSKSLGEAAFNKVFKVYKFGAKERGYSFELSKEEFKEITQKNCHYCDSPPNTVKHAGKNTGTYIYNGIDRVDNNLGYIKENVVPCCRKCNVMKMNLSLDEFQQHITKIYLKFQEK